MKDKSTFSEVSPEAFAKFNKAIDSEMAGYKRWIMFRIMLKYIWYFIIGITAIVGAIFIGLFIGGNVIITW